MRAPKAKAAVPAPAYPQEPVSHSVDVRQISNGYVARHTKSGGSGGYQTKEVYHPTLPPFLKAMTGGAPLGGLKAPSVPPTPTPMAAPPVKRTVRKPPMRKKK